MARTSRYDTREWVRKLYKMGIREFIYKDLPAEMRMIKYFSVAIRTNFITCIGWAYSDPNTKVKKWKISNDIMTMSLRC